MTSGSPTLKLLRNRGITTELYNHDELINFNRQNMSIVLPDLSPTNTNPKINIAHQYGCQMVAMNLSKDDGLLDYYEGERGLKLCLQALNQRICVIFLLRLKNRVQPRLVQH